MVVIRLACRAILLRHSGSFWMCCSVPCSTDTPLKQSGKHRLPLLAYLLAHGLSTNPLVQ